MPYSSIHNFLKKFLYDYCLNSQGMKQLMCSLGLILLAIVLVPVLEKIMTGTI
ncbi:MAG: Maff2 family protein [Oscillospiraceae bacterium]